MKDVVCSRMIVAPKLNWFIAVPQIQRKRKRDKKIFNFIEIALFAYSTSTYTSTIAINDIINV